MKYLKTITRQRTSSLGSQRVIRFTAVALIAGTLAVSSTACTPQIDFHGHVFSENEINQIQPGQSKDQVRLAFGTPDTVTTIGGGVFYYISSTQKTIAFMKPEVVDRRVVAVYFNQDETVKQVANYGLKDGKVFDFISRETPSHGSEAGLIKQLFRNLGKGGVPGGIGGVDPTQ